MAPKMALDQCSSHTTHTCTWHLLYERNAHTRTLVKPNPETVMNLMRSIFFWWYLLKSYFSNPINRTRRLTSNKKCIQPMVFFRIMEYDTNKLSYPLVN